MIELRKYLEQQGFYRIPLRKLKTGHYKLKAIINDRKGEFILDTGASTSCIGFTYADHFHLLSEESEIKAAGAGATNMATKLSRKNSLKLGGMKVQNVPFVLFDLTHVNEALAQVDEPSVHGILGAELLKKHRAVIDYGRNAVYIK